jgi:hypothetical protein
MPPEFWPAPADYNEPLVRQAHTQPITQPVARNGASVDVIGLFRLLHAALNPPPVIPGAQFPTRSMLMATADAQFNLASDPDGQGTLTAMVQARHFFFSTNFPGTGTLIAAAVSLRPMQLTSRGVLMATAKPYRRPYGRQGCGDRPHYGHGFYSLH